MGLTSSYRNRCDLYRAGCTSYVTTWKFDIFKPSKLNSNANIVSQSSNKNVALVDLNKAATQKFRAYAYVRDGTRAYKDITVNVKLMCDVKATTIAKTSFAPVVTARVGEPYTYEFGAFKVVAQPNCGWRGPYSVTTEPDFLLMPNKAIAGYNNRKLTNVTPEDCKKACLAEKAFVCKSIDYVKAQKYCDLSAVSRSQVGSRFHTTTACDYYELSSGDKTKIKYPPTGTSITACKT